MKFFSKILLILLIFLGSSCGKKSPITPPDNLQIINFDEDKE